MLGVPQRRGDGRPSSQRRPGPRPHPPAARRLLLAAARRLRRRRGQGRGHGHGRLRPLGAALLRRRLGAGRSAPARRSTWRSTAASARSGSTSSPRPAATRSCAWPRTTTSCSRASARASSTGSASATRPARGEPADRLLRDHRLRPDGPNTARAGHDMNYLGAQRAARADRRADGRPIQSAGQIADLGGGALMAALRRPGRAARARALGRGPARRRLDDRRRALVAGDGRRRVPVRRPGPAARRPRCSTAASPATCPTRRGRLGHLRRAGAEVLAGLLRGRRARGPDRAPVRAPGLGGPRGGRRGLPRRGRGTSGRRSTTSTTR